MNSSASPRPSTQDHMGLLGRRAASVNASKREPKLASPLNEDLIDEAVKEVLQGEIPIRSILDTSVLISSLYQELVAANRRRGGSWPPHSDYLPAAIDEFVDVSQLPYILRLIEPADAEEVANLLRPGRVVCPDPDNSHVPRPQRRLLLALAAMAQVDLLVSRDEDLLSLQTTRPDPNRPRRRVP